VSTQDCKGNTPLFFLHDCASERHEKIAELLISKGAEFGPTEVQQGTIICTAVRLGWDGILEYAVAKGYDVNAKINTAKLHCSGLSVEGLLPR
jgi:hypothetical protein